MRIEYNSVNFFKNFYKKIIKTYKIQNFIEFDPNFVRYYQFIFKMYNIILLLSYIVHVILLCYI